MWGGGESNQSSLHLCQDHSCSQESRHVKATLILKNHINAGTILILENHSEIEVTLIPENHVDVETGTVHVHASMLTGVRIPQRSDVPTTQLWML